MLIRTHLKVLFYLCSANAITSSLLITKGVFCSQSTQASTAETTMFRVRDSKDPRPTSTSITPRLDMAATWSFSSTASTYPPTPILGSSLSHTYTSRFHSTTDTFP